MTTTTFPLSHRLPVPRGRDRLRELLRGGAADPAWARPALIALLALTATAYLINLTASGYANSFYAAAVQAATRSWKAFFFGSIDSSSFITVDKPPASLWVMAISGRLFGFSSASMLVPQVLEGVAAVALLCASVKRWFGAGAGLLAGSVLALTPVAALMFRFNNPDALLVCLLVASAYCMVRALERGSTAWLAGAGTLIGFAFLAKMMQAFLVVPGFALVYLIAAPGPIRRRIVQLLWGGLAIVVSAGWWVAAVALWPTASRPMIDGSPSNDIFNLILGYNGLGRLFGSGGPAGGGPGGGGGGFSGQTGVLRLFNDVMAGQASWLLPAAGVALVCVLWTTRRAPRDDRARAAALLWGGWLLISGAVFSLSSGVIHTYYTVALAPAIGGLVAVGAAWGWRRRERLSARLGMSAAIAATGGWAIVLLERSAGWQPWLRPLIGVCTVLACGLILAHGRFGLKRRGAGLAAVLSLIACLAAPAAYSAETISSAHMGSVPSAGPSSGSDSGPGGGPGGPWSSPGRAFTGNGAGTRGNWVDSTATNRQLGAALRQSASRYRWAAATLGSQSAASYELASGGAPVMAIGGFNNNGGNLTLARFEGYVRADQIHYYIPGGGMGGGGALGGAVGSPPSGGFPQTDGPPQSSPAAAGGPPSGGAAGVPPPALPSGAPFAPSSLAPPALAPSARAGFAPPGGLDRGAGNAISTWVQSHFQEVRLGGVTMYDLTKRVKS